MTLVAQVMAISTLGRSPDAEYQENFSQFPGYRLYRVWKTGEKALVVYVEEGVAIDPGVVTARTSLSVTITSHKAVVVEHNHGSFFPECFGRGDVGLVATRALISHFLRHFGDVKRFIERDDQPFPFVAAQGDVSYFLTQDGEKWFTDLGLNGPQAREHFTRYW